MTAETTLTLAHETGNIVAVKEASGNLTQIMQIVKGRPDHFSVISGDDAISLPMVAVGCQGVISVAANAFPREISTIIRKSLENQYFEAQNAQYKMFDIFDLLFTEGSPPGIKAALHILGMSQNVVRLPLVKKKKKTYQKIEKFIKELKF
jgi:4-hydroxy-tetrahydrodipicolinate synthase